MGNPVMRQRAICATSPVTRATLVLAALLLSLSTSAASARPALQALAKLPKAERAATLGSFSRPQMRALLRQAHPDPELVGRLKGERLALVVAGLQDRLYWAGPSRPVEKGRFRIGRISTRDVGQGAPRKERNVNDFALWIRGEAAAPKGLAKMNCWEGVMVAAFEAGLVTKKQLVALHDRASAAASSAPTGEARARYAAELERGLGFDRALPLGTRPLRAGDIVFFNGADHVTVALGTKDHAGQDEVMSLWLFPKNKRGYDNNFKRTTIAEIVTTLKTVGRMKDVPVTAASVPW